MLRQVMVEHLVHGLPHKTDVLARLLAHIRLRAAAGDEVVRLVVVQIHYRARDLSAV